MLVQRSPSLAGLGRGHANRASIPTTSTASACAVGGRGPGHVAQGTLTADLVIDAACRAVVRPCRFNQPGAPVADLIDATARVTDVRIERRDG